MKLTHILLGVLAVAFSGCANLSTVDRKTELPDGGKAVHLDAPQRLAIANKLGKMCAEPSPDAMQAYASSLGAGFAAPSKESVSVAQALSTSAGSIGLRTQSITLMRDELFQICLLYYNGGLNENAALILLERSQDLSLGILAIEQLTGAVVAQQVNINTSSAATSAASINDTQKELDKAKADEKTKQATADSAQTALDTQKKIVADKTTEATTAKTNAKSTQAAIDKLTPALVEAQTALETAESDNITLRSQVVAHQTKISNLGDRSKTQQKQVDDLHVKTLATEKAYQDALKAAPKNEKKVGELDAARKGASAAEKDATDTLTQTEKDLASAKTELDTAKVAAKTADSAVIHAQDNLDQIFAQIKALRDDPIQMAADKTADELKTAMDNQKKKQDALDAAEKTLAQAQDNTKEIEKLGNSAATAANASGSGAGSFSTSTSRYGVSKDTVEALAKATTEIVKSVLAKGHLTDSCAAILFQYAKDPVKMQDAMVNILPICQKAIDASLYVYKYGNGTAPASAAAAAVPAAVPAAAPADAVPAQMHK